MSQNLSSAAVVIGALWVNQQVAGESDPCAMRLTSMATSDHLDSPVCSVVRYKQLQKDTEQPH